jgi:heme-degrading monooxygenase HmoA
MYARVTSFPGLAPERIAATLKEFEEQQLPILEQQGGFRGVWAGVDRNAGRAMAVTFWETQEDLRATDKLAAQVKAVAVATSRADREPITDRYEVVLRKEVGQPEAAGAD